MNSLSFLQTGRIAALAALCALPLAGCIDSSSPILVDAEPVFGPQLRLQVFTLRKGYAHDSQQASYRWNGALYAHAGGGMKDITAFSAHPFEDGDYIIQAVPAGRVAVTDYALLHKVAEGVYQVIPIDEDDADQVTRTSFCKKVDKSSCRIETREQLFSFARATAAQRKDDGGLAIRLPDGGSRPARGTRR